MTGATWSRRTLLLGTAAGLAVSGCSAAGPTASGRLRIATGNAGAVFDRYGSALAAEAGAAMPEVVADVLRTAGSVGNVEAVAAGDADVGFCLGDTATLALAGDAPFDGAVDLDALTRLYDSFLQVVVAADSPVRSVADLRGRRLAAGEAASGTRIAAVRVIAAAGLPSDAVDLPELSLADSITALAAGDVDGLAFVSGFPVPALVELSGRVRLRALDLGSLVPALVERHGPQYVAGPLAAGPYGLPRPVETVSVKTYLVCRPDLPEPIVRGLLSVVFQGQRKIEERVPDVRQPTEAAGMFTAPLPLHPGSTEWFREADRRGG